MLKYGKSDRGPFLWRIFLQVRPPVDFENKSGRTQVLIVMKRNRSCLNSDCIEEKEDDEMVANCTKTCAG
jgi:hypothetical protein